MNLRAPIVLTTLLATLVAAGCGGSDDPEPAAPEATTAAAEPDPSSAPDAAATPAATSAPEPAEATAASGAAAEEAFIEEAEGVCRSFEDAELQHPLRADDADAMAADGGALAAVLRQKQAALGALTPPATMAESYAGFMADLDRTVDAFEADVAAAKAGTLTADSGQTRAARRTVEATAAALGFTWCP